MKQTIDLIYKRTPTGPALTDKEGCAVRVEDILSRIYRLEQGRRVLVRLRADDGRHEPLEFNMETVRAIQSYKIRGAFSTEGGQKVNIYNSNIKGEWPILGATWDGVGLRWDAEGNPDNGDPRYRLVLLGEVEADEAFRESGTEEPAPGETGGEKEAEE